ncbi:hypothetical protein DPMN_123768 [Dreissena polymorpha]|uniref:Uncharacterized protein n=1 Tax=Dreissena polymorpha TaxID=45954 RepID=A0A9D4GV38_DREPO|nr:hypothetical protein DPMN_123768 [Dreissena polymorpha]
MHMGSIKPIGQFVDELWIGNELVYRPTDWTTDRQTGRHPAKQYTPSSSKRVIITKLERHYQE